MGCGTTRLSLRTLQISPDTLRGMARILQPSGGGDPIAYNLNVDGALRNLIGFGAPIGVRSPRSKQSGLRGLPFPLNVERVSLGSAHAAEADVKKLNQWVPGENELRAYLVEVRNLLAALGDKGGIQAKLAEEHKSLIGKLSSRLHGRRVVGASSSKTEKAWSLWPRPAATSVLCR